MQFLAGVIIFQSNNLEEQIPSFLKGYQAVLMDDTPTSYGSYVGVVNLPQATHSLAVFVTWTSPDHEAGQAYFDKIRALGTVVVDTVATMRPVEFSNLTSSATPWGIYGSLRCIYVETFSDKFIEVFTRNAVKLPPDPCTCFVIQQIHGNAAQPNPGSSFLRREPHFMVEIIASTQDEKAAAACISWQNECYEDMQASGVRFPGSYISITPPGSVSVQEIYGNNYEKLLGLKRKYDPGNVFKKAYPKFDYLDGPSGHGPTASSL